MHGAVRLVHSAVRLRYAVQYACNLVNGGCAARSALSTFCICEVHGPPVRGPDGCQSKSLALGSTPFYLFTYLIIYLFICSSIYLFIYLFIYLLFYLFIYLSIYLIIIISMLLHVYRGFVQSIGPLLASALIHAMQVLA